MWRFPKIGVPPNHKELVRFSIINQPFLGYPHLWKAPCGVSKFFRNHQQSFSVLVESVESGTALRHRRFATLYRDGLGGRSWDSILLGWEAIKPPKTESNNRRMETRASKNSGGKVPKFIYWNVVRRSHFVSFSLLFFSGGNHGLAVVSLVSRARPWSVKQTRSTRVVPPRNVTLPSSTSVAATESPWHSSRRWPTWVMSPSGPWRRTVSLVGKPMGLHRMCQLCLTGTQIKREFRGFDCNKSVWW